MPMFEYRCADCGAVNEFLIGVTAEDPEIVCAGCGGDDLQKMISPISFTMKEGSSRGEGASRFPIAGQCACGQDAGSGQCGGGGCSCSA